MEENLNQETLADGVDVASADGGGSDSEVVALKDIMSKELGKNFATDEEALKAVKDTFNYVGKVGKYSPYIEKLEAQKGGEANVTKLMEQLTNPQPEVKPEGNPQFVSKQQYETDTFFAKHSELEPHRELLEALSTKHGKTLGETSELPAFKSVFEKVQAHDAGEKSKSVLHTNPRIGQVTNKLSEAKDAAVAGNYAKANSSAVGAVLDAFEGR